jgi:hypothetical protein
MSNSWKMRDKHNMKDKQLQSLINYAKAQPNKSKDLPPFNPDDYVWQAKGTKWKQLLVILLSPLSCILVWVWLAFLSSK